MRLAGLVPVLTECPLCGLAGPNWVAVIGKQPAQKRYIDLATLVLQQQRRTTPAAQASRIIAAFGPNR